MAGKRHEGDGRVCCCDRADGSCAGLAVRRLSQQRVRELAEEIWATSSGAAETARRLPDPRSGKPGASAQAAYRRHREEELADWRKGLHWRAAVVALVGVAGGVLIGLTVGVWAGWPMALLAAALTGWHLRFRPSPSTAVWRRQAAAQRRTAAALRPLEREGYLVLHDVALPGWPASLDHLVVGPTGAWAIESWRPGRLAALRRRAVPASAEVAAENRVGGLHWQAGAVAEAIGGSLIPVQPLRCVHGSLSREGRRRLAQAVPTVPLRQLAHRVRERPSLHPTTVQRAVVRALEVLRPAA
jgi:Nuclease-related domain